ncbi:MAG: Sec-independent protein translocase subunit TatA/TatB [Ilumatobacteraceae bacterium]
MFNIDGSEMIFLLLVALVVLGPEKLPDAVRKFAKGYAEFRKMATGFQGELKSVLDEPMRELRGTADAVMNAARLDLDLSPATGTPAPGANVPMASATGDAALAAESAPAPASPGGLDFGNVAERRRERAARAEGGDTASEPAPSAHEPEPWE